VRLAVGLVLRAHGVRGRLLIAPYNAESTALETVKRIFIDGRELEIARGERANLGWLVALRGIDDRDAADAFRGKEVEVERDELPQPGADELSAIDLIGFEVVDQNGDRRGVVEGLEEAGPQDLLKLAGGALVPLALVKEVVSEARRIVIDVPEGLFDLEE